MWLRPRKISIRIHDGVRDQTNTVIKTWVGPSRAVAENLKNSSCRKLVLNHLYAFDGMGSLGLKALFFWQRMDMRGIMDLFFKLNIT